MSVSHPISSNEFGSTRTTSYQDSPRNIVSTNSCGMNRMVPWNRLIRREKAIKEWKRAWKLNLIEKTNPEWVDLYETLL